MKPYLKFGLIIAVVVGTLGWLAVGGVNETKTYYKTVAEIQKMGSGAMGKKLRVGGDVVKGSIKRNGTEVTFDLRQMPDPENPNNPANKAAADAGLNTQILRVVYTGTEPLPDTFRDNAQALADGKLNPDGSFNASRIQAKCASKYQAKPGQMAPGTEPTYAPGVTKSEPRKS